MKKIFAYFVHHTLLVNVATIFVVILGVGSYLTLTRNSYPVVDLGQVIITTTFPGASPEDVELFVTDKIEHELKQVTDIKKITSFSMENLSLIKIRLNPDDQKEYPRIKREIRDAVYRVNDFPKEVKDLPSIIEKKSSIFPIYEIGVVSQQDYGKQRQYVKSLIRKLEKIPGVSTVRKFGLKEREVRIQTTTEILEQTDLSLQEIASAIAGRNIQSTGGHIRSLHEEKNISLIETFSSPLDVGKVIVRSSFRGPALTVSDVASVVDSFEEDSLISKANGKRSISLSILKTDDADILRTVKKIEALIEKEKKIVQDQFSLVTSYNESRYVKNRFEIVIKNGLIGLFLVLIVLWFFLNGHSAFWVAAGIPLTMMGIFFLIPLFGTHLDSITLTAIVLVIGIVVDDAIIISENIYRKFELGFSASQAAIEGLYEVYKPVLTTILTTIIAFAPMFFMTGTMGNFIYVIPLTICLALTVSMFEAYLILPNHLASGLIEKRRAFNRRKMIFLRLQELHQKLIKKILEFRYLVLGFFVLLMMVSFFFAFSKIDFDLFPSKFADRFILFLEMPAGSSLIVTEKKTSEVENILLALGDQELDFFATRVGGYLDAEYTEFYNQRYSTMIVNLSPFTDRTRDIHEIIETLRSKISKLQGIKKFWFMIDNQGPPVGRPISLQIVSAQDENRLNLAQNIVERLSNIQGVKDIHRNDQKGRKRYVAHLNHKKISQLQLPIQSIAQTLRIAFDGQVVTTTRYGDDDVEFRLMLTHENQSNQETLRKISVPNSLGQLIPLGKVAHFEEMQGIPDIFHFDRQRAITVSAEVDKEIITPLKATQKLLSSINIQKDFPGTYIVLGGEVEESQESFKSLLIVMIYAVIGIYFLLAILFSSMTQPLMVLIAIPFSFIGVILAFLLHQEPFSFLSTLGVTGLMGVVVNDSLILVNYINELRGKQAHESLASLLIKASVDRFRAILITTLTTVGGLLPLAYGIGGLDPYMSPMALALGYGLLFATPLTLYLIPCLYLVGHDTKKFFAALLGAKI
ncbi:MAG: efflux RND transporter permease subunit [Bdellovibrionales bacterium]|nr:efflux RND transporter permease subunit [Bdellovibrionales bacterium]